MKGYFCNGNTPAASKTLRFEEDLCENPVFSHEKSFFNGESFLMDFDERQKKRKCYLRTPCSKIQYIVPVNIFP